MEVLLIFLISLSAVGNTVSHIIFKETPRVQVSRIALNEWRPLRQSSAQIIRYPVYKKIYTNTKKDNHDLAVDGSDQILQHYSPAPPPSILGSLSMFGHATVKARQHATHINKNSNRPIYHSSPYYQPTHKHASPYFISYKETENRPNNSPASGPYRRQPFYTEDRTPSVSHYQPAQSTSLAANTYYFEQQPSPQPFVPSTRDHSFEKVRKPTTETYNLQYSIPTLDYQGLTYYTANNYQELYRNPFGDIRLGEMNRDQGSHINEASPAIDTLYEHMSIRKPLHRTTTSTKSTSTFTPIGVTTYSSPITTTSHPSKLATINFSQVSQPFQLETSKPHHENDFTESVYPMTVTTVDIPEAVSTDSSHKAIKHNSKPHLQQFVDSEQTTDDQTSVSQPILVSSEEPFLPTPAPDLWSVPQQHLQTDVGELTTQQILDTTALRATEDEPSVTEIVPIETTTKRYKTRRRPHRRPTQTVNKVNNERLNEESTTTMDYSKYNRRRKPVNKNYTSSDSKRNRLGSSTTTSTTTPAPIIETSTGYNTMTPFLTMQQEFQTELPEFSSSSSANSFSVEPTANDDHFNAVKFDETTQDTLKIISSSSIEPEIVSTSTTPTTTTSAPTFASKIRIKYGSNRPRFSVKDYRERLKTTTTTSLPDVTRNDSRSRLRGSIKDDTMGQSSEMTTEPKYRYKSRITASRYRTSTTSPDLPAERVNTFRPTSNRYKSSNGKYYSRYRTSTVSPKEVEDKATTANSTRMSMKTKGVFSAKRRPFPLNKQKLETPITMEAASVPTEIFRLKENEVIPSSPTKSIEETYTTMSSKEDENVDPTGQEAIKIADLTSSSTNQFKQQHSSTPTILSKQINRRKPSISLPRDEPILPLEAFFQTQNQDS